MTATNGKVESPMQIDCSVLLGEDFDRLHQMAYDLRAQETEMWTRCQERLKDVVSWQWFTDSFYTPLDLMNQGCSRTQIQLAMK